MLTNMGVDELWDTRYERKNMQVYYLLGECLMVSPVSADSVASRAGSPSGVRDKGAAGSQSTVGGSTMPHLQYFLRYKNNAAAPRKNVQA